LNGLNDLNRLQYFLARGIALLLERRFQLKKAAPKLLNRAYSAPFFAQINGLRWSEAVQARVYKEGTLV